MSVLHLTFKRFSVLVIPADVKLATGTNEEQCHFCLARIFCITPAWLKKQNKTDPFFWILKMIFSVTQRGLLWGAIGFCSHVNGLSRNENGNARLWIYKDKPH